MVKPMLVRVAFGLGLAALGYFVGREIGRNESVRAALERDDGLDSADSDGTEPRQLTAPGEEGEDRAAPARSG